MSRHKMRYVYDGGGQVVEWEARFSRRNSEPKLRENRLLIVEIGYFELADFF